MSVKRSRLSESSNFVEKDLFNQMSLPSESAREVRSAAPPSGERKPPKCLRPSLDESNKEQLWQNAIFMSPARESISGGFGNFLKYCYFCTKNLKQDADMFMYRDYCAFCSEKCRDYQIELDKFAQSRAVVEEKDVNNLVNGSLLNQ